MSIGPFLLSIGILCHTFWLRTYYAEDFFTFLGPSHEVFREGQIKRYFAAFLVACTLCWLVGPSVRRSVGPSVRCCSRSTRHMAIGLVCVSLSSKLTHGNA